MNTHPHLEQSLQKDLEHLRGKISEMASLSERALKTSMQAFTENNRPLAYSVILRDRYIDELETEVDRLSLEFLVRHQPVGQHLRFIFAAIQINKDLERIGDYGESIARQTLVLSELGPLASYALFVELGDVSLHMLRDAVQSFLRQDGVLARSTMLIEDRANSLRNRINTELTEMSRQNRLGENALPALMTVARRLERAADQAKNLCEDVLYMCTGEFVRHKHGDGFFIVFLDQTNSCLGQMAEAIGRALAVPRFSFASAGRVPQPVDPRVSRFLSARGIDISQQTSKSLEQLSDWEHAQVIVGLDRRAFEGLGLRSNKPIILDWSMEDPLRISDNADAQQRAFDSAFNTIQAHLKELVAAILSEPQPELKL